MVSVLEDKNEISKKSQDDKIQIGLETQDLALGGDSGWKQREVNGLAGNKKGDTNATGLVPTRTD